MSKDEAIENLNRGLLEVYEQIKPSKSTHSERKAVVKRIKRAIKKIYTTAEVCTFGSFKTHLYLSTSDIDLVVLFKNDNTEINTQVVLRNIKGILINQEIANRSSMMFIKGAKVPVLKFTDATFGYKFDISVNNTSGINAVGFIKEVVEEKPFVKVFFLVLKYFMVCRGLGDAASGGLNSYSQFLLMYNFLQLHPLMQCRAIDPIENIGVLFIEFFQYYGFDFQYHNVTVCVKNVQYKRNWVGRCCIVDPTDSDTNTGSNCRNIRSITKVLQYAYRTMVYSIKNYKEGVNLVDRWFKVGSSR
ncbi:Non-canonical poly(A) RNA polymerase PAPD5 [Nosema granulosis]|uniref:polynucleotide adenylyltransferase n=1 Tax=Nosema granulosis TaxID=83296 RepID=A0A9P6GXC8_9MICR|nr:Non-canonical poly(A) RNA polymerase PAPD5 [Nosema granulosis]